MPAAFVEFRDLNARSEVIFDHICRRCGSANLCRSRKQNLLEHLLAPVLPIYRCMCCSLRQGKFHKVHVGPERIREKTVYAVDWER